MPVDVPSTLAILLVVAALYGLLMRWMPRGTCFT
jgi:hypothetical protein